MLARRNRLCGCPRYMKTMGLGTYPAGEQTKRLVKFEGSTMEPQLQGVIRDVLKFRDDRNWKQYHDPKNLAQAVSIEAAELEEIFLWMTTDQSQDLDPEKKAKLREEIADILIFIIYLCDHFDIDLLRAVEYKIRKNSLNYPIQKAFGSSKKYTEFKE
jgi:NTP pyrophosphatase (non-canonical NTP hydrolase)